MLDLFNLFGGEGIVALSLPEAVPGYSAGPRSYVIARQIAQRDILTADRVIIAERRGEFLRYMLCVAERGPHDLQFRDLASERVIGADQVTDEKPGANVQRPFWLAGRVEASVHLEDERPPYT